MTGGACGTNAYGRTYLSSRKIPWSVKHAQNWKNSFALSVLKIMASSNILPSF